MPETPSRLRGDLDRWLAAGIIDAEQAAKIESAEQARTGPSGETARRGGIPLVAEMLGYLGAVIVISAGYIAVRQLWPRVPTTATLAFTGTVAVGLIVLGALLRPKNQPAYGRMRSMMWLLATFAGAWFAATAANQAHGLADSTELLIAAATWAGLALPLWWFGKSPVQHVALFGGLLALLSAALDQLHPGLSMAGYGTAIWVLSAIWGVIAYLGYVAPPVAGLAAASAGVLLGATLTMGNPAGLTLAVLTVAGLLGLGVATSRVLFTGFGAAGTLWVVPVTANRYLPGSVAAPLSVVVAGLVLLAIALRLTRVRRKAR